MYINLNKHYNVNTTRKISHHIDIMVSYHGHSKQEYIILRDKFLVKWMSAHEIVEIGS
jgi:hypothetical protein